MGQVVGYLYGSGDYKIKEITVAKTKIECDLAVERLCRECSNSFPVLGMDCEWVPEWDPREKNPVALLQLATLSGYCVLFRLSFMGSIPGSVKNLLCNRSILKVGVAIENDVSRLETPVSGWADLRHLEHLIRCYPAKDGSPKVPVDKDMKLGLASLSKIILGVELNKQSGIHFANWEGQLSGEQIEYAAWDAFAGVCICYEITHQNLSLQAYGVNRPIDFVYRIVEVPYKFRSRSGPGPKAAGGVKNPESSLKKSYDRLLPKRQTPMYDNIFLLAPDGEVLCTCDRRRAMWYVEKGIGELIEEKTVDPDNVDGECKTVIKVRLKFEPKRRAINESEKYYCIVKDNRCVVCGKEDSYLRKHIVPHEYRKYFPVWMKSRQSHDVLLLCINCHIQSNRIDLKLRQKLAKDCQAPLTVAKAIEVKDAPMIRRVLSAARALSRKPEAIPLKRRQELEEIVVNYFSQEGESHPREVTPELLSAALEMTFSVVNECYTPHGLKVVEHFRNQGEENGIRELEILWRKHFVDEMRPRFLPAMWSTHHLRISPERKELESTMLKNDKGQLDVTQDHALS
ncbi:exonuclease 3'-5' domain-containing protein 2 isoform X2 [Ischnura elegans]|uniref:exonuclease 3'-5' domain-containing protein 2 isoform X2 n=1 Tax=Ischnura elegans TaxID=197161 RepID=UPI001ED8B913|nr:exonuclease 3'-5' domain-containing protein 2 isoform X2 [Ischnura elegans]